MSARRLRIHMIAWFLLVGVAMTTPGPVWSQAAPPAETASSSSTSGRTVLAGVGAVTGSVFYAPFKALILCPVSAVAAGATYAVTLGEKDTPEFLLRLGCTGTYFISPAMVQGQDAYRQYEAR